MDINEISNSLHISPLSANIFIQIMTHGEMSKKQLIHLIEKTYKDITSALNELLRRGFVMAFENPEKEELFKTASIMQAKEQADRYQDAIQSLETIVKKNQKDDELGIIKYEGWHGIQQVYLEVLEEAIKTGEPIYAIESNLDKSGIGKIFLEKYIQRRIENEIQAYVISPKNVEDKKYKEKYEKHFTEVKLLKNFPVDANINIVGSLVMSFTIEPPEGTLRWHKSEANTWRSLFKNTWEHES